MDRQAPFNPYPWLIGQNEFRAAARRRYRLVGAVPGARILVVGGGAGDDVLAIAPLLRPGGRAFGVDRAEADVQTARRRAATAGLAAKFHLGAPDDLPFPDASFDGACAVWLATDAADAGAFVLELLRVVRPLGRLVIDEIDWSGAAIDGGDKETAQAIVAYIGEVTSVATLRTRLERLAQAGQLVNLTVSESAVEDRTGGSMPLIAALADDAAAAGAITAESATRYATDLATAVEERAYRFVLPCVTLAGQRA